MQGREWPRRLQQRTLPLRTMPCMCRVACMAYWHGSNCAIHTHHQFTAARRRRYERMKPRSAAWGHGEIRVRCPIIPGALTHPPRPAFAGKKPPPSGPSRHDRRPARALFPPVPDRVERKKKNKLVVWRAPHARARPP
jgi:hypothetical protein